MNIDAAAEAAHQVVRSAMRSHGESAVPRAPVTNLSKARLNVLERVASDLSAAPGGVWCEGLPAAALVIYRTRLLPIVEMHEGDARALIEAQISRLREEFLLGALLESRSEQDKQERARDNPSASRRGQVSMDIKLTQHPVGQGGMMSGLLKVPNARFHWVYDCGSNQSHELNRELETVEAQGGVDILFLSHLDSDHVNGVDRLLARTNVRQVVLPYLSQTDRLVAIGHDMATGRVSGTFIDFISDIEGWLGQRGVEVVTLINPSDDDAEPRGDSVIYPGGRDGGGDSVLNPEWSGRSLEPGYKPTSIKGAVPQVLRFDLGASLRMDKAGSIDWIMIPFAHRPSNGALTAFETAVENYFGDFKNDPAIISKVLYSKADRDLLRDCYDLIWADHNLVSMALYAGPRAHGFWNGWCECRHGYRSLFNRPSTAGWLSTGDMHLDVGIRRRSFLKHYKDVLENVNVFGLPHHGSDLNFHASLLPHLPNVQQFIASSGPNTYGHPGKLVEHLVKASKKEFVKVSEKAASMLSWHFRT